MREALGVTTSEKFGVYTSTQVSHLRDLLATPALEAPTRDTPLFVVVDPTGGGSSVSVFVLRRYSPANGADTLQQTKRKWPS